MTKYKSLLRSILIPAASLILSGCMHLYDPVSEEQANKGVELLNKVNLQETASSWGSNLNDYLTVELDLVDNTTSFLLKNDVWRMASGNVNLAELYLEAKQRLDGIGFDSLAEVQKYIDIGITLEEQGKQLVKYRGYIESLSPELGFQLPDCNQNIPETWGAVGGVADSEIKIKGEILYKSYFRICREILLNTDKYHKLGGDLAAARAKRMEIEESLQRRRMATAEKQYEFNKAKQQLIATIDAEGVRSKNKEKLLVKIEDILSKLEGDHEVLPSEVSGAIVKMLSEVQGNGSMEVDRVDGEVYASAVIAKSTQSLSESMDSFLQGKAQPDLPDLVLELNRQVMLRDYSLSRRELLEENLSLARREESLLLKQAEVEYTVAMQLCMFTYGKEKKEGCKKDFKLRLNDESGDIECGLGQFEELCSMNIAFDGVWKSARDNQKRNLLEVVRALSDSHFYRGELSKIAFQRYDLAQREELLASKNAIFQWSNLLNIPAQEIASFYKAGVKTNELADFIVKSLSIAGLVVVAED